MRKITSFLVLVSFILSCVMPPQGFAQTISAVGLMPQPGTMVTVTPAFTPAYLWGMTIHPNEPFKFDFLVQKGDENLGSSEKQAEYTKLIKYFLAALAVPDTEQWVNLSPYEQDRIIPETFGLTEMGRDLLAQDYLLKQLSSSLTDPTGDLGKKFWDGVYAQAHERFGTTNVPTDTFNKVWIMPDKAVVYEKNNTVYVIESHLKVLTDKDYLAMKNNGTTEASSEADTVADISSQVIKEVILPALEKEVNEGAGFAPLRQVYSGMLLATWYKRSLKETILGKLYADQGKVKGIDQDPKANEEIYNKYVEGFKKGVFNMIKEDVDRYTKEVVPRKYFSGGFTNTTVLTDADKKTGEDGVANGESTAEVVEALVKTKGNDDAQGKDDAAMNLQMVQEFFDVNVNKNSGNMGRLEGTSEKIVQYEIKATNDQLTTVDGQNGIGYRSEIIDQGDVRLHRYTVNPDQSGFQPGSLMALIRKDLAPTRTNNMWRSADFDDYLGGRWTSLIARIDLEPVAKMKEPSVTTIKQYHFPEGLWPVGRALEVTQRNGKVLRGNFDSVDYPADPSVAFVLLINVNGKKEGIYRGSIVDVQVIDNAAMTPKQILYIARDLVKYSQKSRNRVSQNAKIDRVSVSLAGLSAEEIHQVGLQAKWMIEEKGPRYVSDILLVNTINKFEENKTKAIANDLLGYFLRSPDEVSNKVKIQRVSILLSQLSVKEIAQVRVAVKDVLDREGSNYAYQGSKDVPLSPLTEIGNFLKDDAMIGDKIREGFTTLAALSNDKKAAFREYLQAKFGKVALAKFAAGAIQQMRFARILDAQTTLVTNKRFEWESPLMRFWSDMRTLARVVPGYWSAQMQHLRLSYGHSNIFNDLKFSPTDRDRNTGDRPDRGYIPPPAYATMNVDQLAQSWEFGLKIKALPYASYRGLSFESAKFQLLSDAEQKKVIAILKEFVGAAYQKRGEEAVRWYAGCQCPR